MMVVQTVGSHWIHFSPLVLFFVQVFLVLCYITVKTNNSQPKWLSASDYFTGQQQLWYSLNQLSVRSFPYHLFVIRYGPVVVKRSVQTYNESGETDKTDFSRKVFVANPKSTLCHHQRRLLPESNEKTSGIEENHLFTYSFYISAWQPEAEQADRQKISALFCTLQQSDSKIAKQG